MKEEKNLKKESEKQNKEEKGEKKEVKEKVDKVERVFTIPLRKAFRKTRNKRVPYAIKLIKEFVRRHMKIKEGEIKIGKHLNEKMWERGIEKPPRRVRVSVEKVESEYRVELFGYKYEEFKPIKTEEKGLTEKLMSRLGPKAVKKMEEEKMISGKTEEKKEKESSKIGSKESKSSDKSEPPVDESKK